MTPSFRKFLASIRSSRIAKALSSNAHLDSETRAYSLHKSTGETVYDDRPLRFRHMTPTEADVRALENETDPAGFKIRISKLRGGRAQAGMLVEKRYSGRGYEFPGFRRERNLHTFIAYDEGRLMGTVGLRLDSRKELSADELYPEELASLRKRQYRLCEFTRLAVDKGGVSKPVLAGLFHTAYLFASVIRGATHAVIEVNPRHVVFYRRVVEIRGIGPGTPEHSRQRAGGIAVRTVRRHRRGRGQVCRQTGRARRRPLAVSLLLFGRGRGRVAASVARARLEVCPQREVE